MTYENKRLLILAAGYLAVAGAMVTRACEPRLAAAAVYDTIIVGTDLSHPEVTIKDTGEVQITEDVRCEDALRRAMLTTIWGYRVRDLRDYYERLALDEPAKALPMLKRLSDEHVYDARFDETPGATCEDTFRDLARVLTEEP